MLSNTEILRVVYRTEAIIQPHAIGVNEIIDISAQKSSIGELIKSAIPSNIFKALSTGNVLQVIIFFIALGVALGYATVNTPNAAIVRKQLVGIFKVFKSINDWVLQFLPLMSFFILAYQSQFLSIDTLFVLVNLAFCITASLSVIIIISMLIIWKRSGQPLMFALREMSSCLSLAFFSRSTLVSSSLAMEVLIDKFKFHPGTIQLVVPLGASMLRFGTISIFCIATILAAHLFSADLGLYDYILLSILSVVASLVALSANNPVDNYKALSVVFTPLGLPSGAVNSIFIALDFISDAFDTMANLMGICLVAALCSPKPEKVVDTTITS
ncbi:MAG: cation:dicarboxylase symporter family transporter [Pseudomonadota bacterium]